MLKYTVQRVLLMLLTLLIITGICFVLVRMLPPVELPPNDPHTQIIEARREAQGYVSCPVRDILKECSDEVGLGRQR